MQIETSNEKARPHEAQVQYLACRPFLVPSFSHKEMFRVDVGWGAGGGVGGR